MLLQANASHAMARHWPGCGRSGTPPTPFTAGRCYCPPQAEVFVKIGERDPATPPCPPAIASCCLQAGIILLPSPSCLLRRHVFSLEGGTPAPPVAFLFTQGRLLLEKFGPRVSLSLSLSAPPSSTTELRLRHLLLHHVFSLAGGGSAPPVSLLINQGACRPLDPLLLEIL